MTVRTRFAPSPTGMLHLGSARTALYCWLHARHTGGQFILRVEDTDRERSTQASVQTILEGMDWLGLDYDEGPFYQTQRMGRYQEVLDRLLNEDKAYRCYCSKERLTELRERQQANKEKPRYDGRCRQGPPAGVADGDSYVVRFRQPYTGEVVVDDSVCGRVVFQNNELDDLIIARSDGSPTYNFTVVVDDWDMEITHVIRGDDHLNNTPRQLNIFHALGAVPPTYAHAPTILGPDGKRYSKRHGAVSIAQFQQAGYLPEALLNYLVRLGWSHGDQEIFSRDELIALFDIANVNRAAATFNPDKLLWLNQHYLKSLSVTKVVGYLQPHLEAQGLEIQAGPDLAALVEAQAERCKTLAEMAEKSVYFFKDELEFDPKAVAKHLKPEVHDVLTTMLDRLTQLTTWQAEGLHQILTETARVYNLGLGKVAQPLRVALTGGTVSPPMDTTLMLLGRERVLERLQAALGKL